MSDPTKIAARLRELSHGIEEWRVQHPVEKSYCYSARGRDSLDPERDVREWLADHRSRFPDSRYAGYEVAKHIVLTQLQRTALEAADLLDPPKPLVCGTKPEGAEAWVQARRRRKGEPRP